jgi:hypothetical protein
VQRQPPDHRRRSDPDATRRSASGGGGTPGSAPCNGSRRIIGGAEF